MPEYLYMLVFFTVRFFNSFIKVVKLVATDVIIIQFFQF